MPLTFIKKRTGNVSCLLRLRAKRIFMDRRNVLKLLPASGLFSFGALAATMAGGDCITTEDILGPYYKPNAPFITDLSGTDTGPKLFISGTVHAADCVTPLPSAVVDVWQANSKAEYHDVNFRAKIQTDQNGHYAFKSVLPGKYLNGSQYRPRHLHYKIHLNGREYLTTQIYFEGDTSIPVDPWASDPSAAKRIIPLSQDKDGNYHGVADITLDVSPLSLENDLLKDAFSLFPVPATGDVIQIRFARNSVGKLIFTDLNGKVLARKDMEGQTSLDLPLSDLHGIRLPKGLYAVYFVSQEGKSHLKRFLVQ